MKLYSTLYYDIVCTFTIRKYNIDKTFVRKHYTLDYESGKEYIKFESINNVFKEEIEGLITEYAITEEDIVLKECNIQQVENVNEFIVIKEDKGFLIAYDIDNPIFKTPIDVLYHVYNEYIEIEIVNSIDYIQYKLEITDGDNKTVKFFDKTIRYNFINKKLNVKIYAYLHDVIINSIEKDLLINSLNNEIIVSNQRTEVTNTHTNKNNVFQSGLEQSDKAPYLSNSNNFNEFDINAIIKGIKTVPTKVYPKVTAAYKMECTYKYKVDKVFGDFVYTMNAKQNGFIKVKLIKSHAKNITTNFDLCGKITMFKTQSNGFKSWVTEDVILNKTYTTSGRDLVYIDNNEQSIKYNNNDLVVQPNDSSVYQLLLNKAKSMFGNIEQFVLHSFKIKNIKCYDGGTLISQNDNAHVTPILASTPSVDISKPLKYIVAPNLIYSGEKIVTKKVTTTSADVITKFDFNFNMTDSDGKIYNGDCDYNIFVIEKDSYVDYKINGTTLTAKSNSSERISEEYHLDDNTSSVTVKLYEKLNLADSELGDDYECDITIRCIGDSVTYNGETISSSKTFKLSGTKYSIMFGVSGIVRKVDYTEKLILPEEGEYRASINGNVMTYSTALRGKEDYNSKEEPFIIPSDAFDIRISTDIYDIYPTEANVISKVIDSNNLDQYSCVIKLSSDYEDYIEVETNEYIETQTFKDYRLSDGYTKTNTLTIKKPSKEYLKYGVSIEPTNSNILTEYLKCIDFGNSLTYNLPVVCKASKHPAGNWNLMLPSSYVYIGEDEFFVYDYYERINANNNKLTLSKIVNTLNPVVVMNGSTTLQRVISTESDGITIREDIKGCNNTFYTKYKNISVTKVLNENGDEIEYIEKNHYIIADCQKCTIYYKVAESFDYLSNTENTIITVNSSNSGSFDVYYYDKDRDINTNISLNPIHSNLSNGYVYIDNSNFVQTINRHEVTINDYFNKEAYIFELYDKYNNSVCEKYDIKINTKRNVINVVNDIEHKGTFKLVTEKSNKPITITLISKTQNYSVKI